MTAPADLVPEFNEVWIGLADTTAQDGYLPVIGPVNTLATATFPAKNTIGDYTKDAEDYISSLIISDISGGMNVEDMNEGSDQARCWTAFMDVRKPGKIALNQLVTQLDIPSGASGTAYTCGQILQTPYVIFGTKIYGRKESDGTWYAGVSTTDTPVGKPVEYAGGIYIPTGTNGYLKITEADSVGSPGVPTVANSTGEVGYPASYTPGHSIATDDSPKALAFLVFDGRLWALSTSGALAWSFTGADGEWEWPYDEARGWYPHVQSGETPKKLVAFYTPTGDPTVAVISDRRVYLYNSSSPPSFVDTPMKFPPHPDNANAAEVWRTSEDLHVALGMDMWNLTNANVVVPMQGLARDDGMPQEYWGRILDLQGEASELFALVGPTVGGGVSAIAFDSKFGSDGSGNGEFSGPRQIALDSSGNIYVADNGNDRVQKFTSGGVWSSDIITSVDEVIGLCIDSSDNIYLSYKSAASTYNVRKYNSSGVLQWTSSSSSGTIRHLATDGTSVFATAGDGSFYKYAVSDGTRTVLASTVGSGDGEFDDPQGIAHNPVNDYVYIVDAGNDRVQYLTTSGVFVGKWGSSGSGSGQFSVPTGIGIHPTYGNVYVGDLGRDDIQVFTPTGAFIRTYGSSGSGDGQFAAINSIVVNSTGAFWVTDTQSGDDRVQKFAVSTTGATVGNFYPYLAAWTGVGWYGKWHGSTPAVSPNWMHITATNLKYALRWGMDDGYCYEMKLRRFFHNPRRGFIAGEDDFQPDGEIVTSKFDAAMLGFWKIADKVIVFLENASDDEYITIEYQTDADASWVLLGTVDTTDKTYLPFAVDANGFSSGVPFNWIQFRIRAFRGSDTTQTPLIKSIVFNYLKVPQNANAFSFVVALPKDEYEARNAQEIRQFINDLVDARAMIRFKPWPNESSKEFRGYLTATSGWDDATANVRGQRSVNFIELRDGED